MENRRDAIEERPDLLETPVLVAGHRLPLLFQHRAHVGLEVLSELAAGGLGEAAHRPEQIQHFVRLPLDRRAGVVELLPDHDDHEGEEHGVDRAERLEVISGNVVAVDEPLPRNEPPDDVESDNGGGDAEPDGGSESSESPSDPAEIRHEFSIRAVPTNRLCKSCPFGETAPAERGRQQGGLD